MWSRAKKAGQRDKATCPICGKTFKTGEYYEFHVKTSHPFGISANNFNYRLGSQDRSDATTSGTNKTLSAQSKQVCKTLINSSDPEVNMKGLLCKWHSMI